MAALLTRPGLQAVELAAKAVAVWAHSHQKDAPARVAAEETELWRPSHRSMLRLLQDSSQVWEERVDETRIITTEGLTTCLDPGRGWTITSGGWNFLKKQECWEGHEQALITTIRKETKRTEELEKAGYRSPTWTVLRALQQINSATRIEGEAAICPPLLSFSRRDEEIFSSGGKKKDQR